MDMPEILGHFPGMPLVHNLRSLALLTGFVAVVPYSLGAQDSSASALCSSFPQGSRSRLQACRAALAKDSLDTRAMYQLGQELYAVFKSDSLDKSLELWERTIRYDRNAVDAHYALAFAYLEQRRYGEAALAARRALALNPNNAQAMMMLQAANRRFIAFGPVVVPDSLIDGSTVAALDDLEHGRWLLKQHPLDSTMAERAHALFSLAIGQLPDTDPRGYVDLASALRVLELYGDARAAIDSALRRDSTYARAYQVRNGLYVAAGHPDSMAITSRAHHERARRRSEERATMVVRTLPSTATVRAGTGAITVISAPVMDKASGDPMEIIRFAEAMTHSGYPEDGVLILRQLARVHPDRADIWAYLAWANFDARRYVEAGKAWAKAEELDRRYFDTRPFAKRDREIAVKMAGAQTPMTLQDLDRPLSRFR